jgi:hypothetical protein
MSVRGIAITWLTLTAVGIGIATGIPAWGIRILDTVHFEDPNPEARARALRIRALHRWETATRSNDGDLDLLDAAERDLEEASQLSPSSTDDLLRRAIREARR